MPAIAYTPDAAIVSAVIDTTPVLLADILEAAGFNTNRELPDACQWATTVELRAYGDLAWQYTILNTVRGPIDDETTATYKVVPADTEVAINVYNAHEKVYIKAAASTTVVLEFYGSATPSAPV